VATGSTQFSIHSIILSCFLYVIEWNIQEIEQHPFFMTKLPEEGEPLPPLLEAIQQLKYDPEQNTTEGIYSTL